MNRRNRQIKRRKFYRWTLSWWVGRRRTKDRGEMWCWMTQEEGPGAIMFTQPSFEVRILWGRSIYCKSQVGRIDKAVGYRPKTNSIKYKYSQNIDLLEHIQADYTEAYWSIRPVQYVPSPRTSRNYQAGSRAEDAVVKSEYQVSVSRFVIRSWGW